MTKDLPGNPPADRKTPSVHLYAPADPIPVPEAVESDTDTVWGLWQDLAEPKQNSQDADFESTQAADLCPETPSLPASKRQP